jgi:hypothetical protein
MSLSSAGLLTIADDLIIGDGKTIGSASDPDAMSIAAGGAVTFSQVPLLPDNTVATADIQANAVTGAKFNADVISAQTALAAEPADTDEFLVSDAGVLKRIDYSLIKGGGLHTLISTTTVSSAVAIVEFTGIDTTYDRYYIRISGVRGASDNQAFFIMLGDASNYSTNGQDTTKISYKHDETDISHFRSQDDTQMMLCDDVDNLASGAIYSDVNLFDITSTSVDPRVSATTNYTRRDIATQQFMNARIDEDDRNFDRVKFLFASGNIAAGVFKIYGVS